MDIKNFKKQESKISIKEKKNVDIKSHKELATIFILGMILIIIIYLLLVNILDNTSYDKDKYGNTNGNINGSALAVNKGEETYFSNISCDENIYKIKNGSKAENLKISGWCMSIYDEYLYYIDDKSECIYKMDTKNSKKYTKISDEKVKTFNIVNGWIYYIENSNESEICKMKIDGTKKKVICKDGADNIVIYKNWIYFINNSEGGYLYKVRTNGWSKKKVNQINTLCFDIEDDWIYYVPVELSDGQIRQMKLNGDKDNKLFEINTYQINIENGFMYCANIDGITKVNLKSKKKLKIFNYYSEAMSILDDWIYFVSMEKDNEKEGLTLGKLYRIKNDGKSLERIAID